MGQNNDVAWTFTNVMADIEDLFIERIEGDRYEFEGEWRQLELVDEEIDVKGRDDAGAPRGPDHPPRPDRQRGARRRRLAAAGAALGGARRAGHRARPPRDLRPDQRRGAGRAAGGLDDAGLQPRLGRPPRQASATRPSAASRRRPGGCPDLPKPGWTGEFEWEGAVPYEELPELVDPEAGFLVTANNRIADDDYPHHITSDYLDGFRAKRIEQLIEATPTSTTSTASRRMQTDLYSIPGDEVVHRLARLDAPGASARRGRSSG